MCGIAGIVGELDPRAANTAVRGMCDAQAHRGPDDSGLIDLSSDKAVVLGHRRLSIIDTSAGGHQPMATPDGKVWITFNGEIYNYRELRLALQGRGHRFRTHSDTEVLLADFAERGVESLRGLRGIFAFAVVDLRGGEPVVTLARDHLGVKPLYYSASAERLVFASEVRAVLASQFVDRRLDLDGVASFLSYGSVQEPFTMIEGVRSLPAGHFMTWKNGQSSVRAYWTPPAGADPGDRGANDVERLLETGVQRQLLSDVPLGIFLSGGIDSSAIAAMASRATGGSPLHTLAVVFDDGAYDERRFARMVADKLGTQHQEVHVTADATIAALPAALASFDQPSVDGLNTYFVSRAAHDAGLTVALSGLGGDELFAGYDAFKKQRQADSWKRVAGALRALLPGSAGALASLADRTGRESMRKAADLIGHRGDPYFVTRRMFGKWQADRLLQGNSSDWADEAYGRMISDASGYDLVNRTSLFEMSTFMLSTLLRDSDQMSMAHAIELRVPLLDVDLVEAVLRIPGEAKIDDAVPKPLLTRTIENQIPRECIYRPKQGFELPLSSWLRRALGTHIKEVLFGFDPARIPLDPAEVRRVWREFEAGRLGWSRPWALFVLISWLTRHGVSLNARAA